MATIINTPPNTTQETTDNSGWAVAVIILIAVIAAGAYWFYHRGAIRSTGTTNVNVTLPTPQIGGNGSTNSANQ